MHHRISHVLVVVFLLCSGYGSIAQKKVWIYHHDTLEISAFFSLSKPAICSEWLQACTYRIDSTQKNLLESLNIPHSPVLSFQSSSVETDTLKYGFALEQIEARYFSELNLTGKGVKIGIIDGGFLMADQRIALTHLFSRQQIVAYRDYITPDLEKYGGIAALDDEHGTDVLQLTGGWHPEKKVLHGLATDAIYYLARTDHGGYEKRIEEDYLIRALEWMHQEGIKLVNISLGYNKGFNDPSENYVPDQMDGKTTMVARAVEIAATQKGMLIIVAAGNEATDKDWRIISSPADAQHALAVGSCKYDLPDKTNYSSIGPEFLPYVKPDLVVYSTSGTSFSAPVITGLAACMIEYDSLLTNFEIIDLLKKSGNFYPYPNNYVGHGVPSCRRILYLLKGEEKRIKRPKRIKSGKNRLVLRTNNSGKYIVVYHKKTEHHVTERYILRPKGKKLKIQRPEGIARTSVLTANGVTEIFWE